MSGIKLKSCPFCEGEAVLTEFYESCDGRGDVLPYIKCKDCGAEISLTYEELRRLDEDYNFKGGYRSQNKKLLEAMHDKIIEKWNTRKTVERIVERVEEEKQNALKLWDGNSRYKGLTEVAKEYKDGWIPCSDRIPACAGKYLVTTDGTFGIDVIDIALFESYEWHKSADIIAWQPLPNPYKKEV